MILAIFKWISVIDGWGISCEIALIWMSLDCTDDQSTLVHVMAWCHQATSHYLSQCWPRSLSPYGVTRPQWVEVRCVPTTPLWTINLALCQDTYDQVYLPLSEHPRKNNKLIPSSKLIQSILVTLNAMCIWNGACKPRHVLTVESKKFQNFPSQLEDVHAPWSNSLPLD